MIYGYIRVSTKEQNEERQVLAMQNYGVDRIFLDKQSGKNFERAEYQKMIEIITADDDIVVKSIDRLGRNYNEVLEQWRVITKEKQASVVVLDMPLLDTKRDRDLTGILIADIVLQLLSYVAQIEREFIRQRQKEGIAAAKLKGVRFGRPRKCLPENFHAMLLKWKKGEISGTSAARECNMPVSTFYCRARDSREATRLP